MVEILNLSHQSLKCNDYKELERLIQALKRFFHIEASLFCHANVIDLWNDYLNESNIGLFNISYPEEYLEVYVKNKYYNSDAVLFEFAANLSPINWKRVDEKCDFNYPAVNIALDFNLYDGWTHGIIDPTNLNVHMLFWGSSVVDSSIRTEKILEYLVPFYCEAYKRINKNVIPLQKPLTKREIEVLEWIKDGKSSWEISVIMKLSKRTIDFHIGNIKKKLNAVTRAQAVAAALHRNIISF